MLPKFTEDCNRLLPDEAADSARRRCRSTMPARELSANTEETITT